MKAEEIKKNEFIEFAMNMYANRDAYSRGKIIEDLRDKALELLSNTKDQTEEEKVNIYFPKIYKTEDFPEIDLKTNFFYYKENKDEVELWSCDMEDGSKAEFIGNILKGESENSINYKDLLIRFAAYIDHMEGINYLPVAHPGFFNQDETEFLNLEVKERSDKFLDQFYDI